MPGTAIVSESLLPADILDLARRVVEENRAAGRKIALAESCTGGLIAKRLTERAGSSDYMAGGVVAYANDVKTSALDVPAALMERLSTQEAELLASVAAEPSPPVRGRLARPPVGRVRRDADQGGLASAPAGRGGRMGIVMVLLRWALLAVAVVLAAWVTPDVDFGGGPLSALVVAALVAAANVLGMTQVSQLLNQVLLWIPNLLVAAVILLVAPDLVDVTDADLHAQYRQSPQSVEEHWRHMRYRDSVIEPVSSSRPIRRLKPRCRPPISTISRRWPHTAKSGSAA